MTYDGSALRLYVDGVEKNNNESISGSLKVNSRDFRIGSSSSTGDKYFNGTIDEVRFSASARSGIGFLPRTTTRIRLLHFIALEVSRIVIRRSPFLTCPRILFAVGLLVLAGYVMLRSRNRE